MITFGFFDSVNGDRKYSADDISNFFETLIPDGVMAEPENTLQVCESSGLTVKVLPGWGFIGRKWIHNDAELFLTLDQPDIILNRADRIVIRLNRDVSLRNMEIAVKRGTPGESPVIPALQRDENVWEISLAYIMVWAGRTEIYQNDIGDERGDTNLCSRILGFSKVREMQNLLNTYDESCYHCNGINDNITLPAFIENWKLYHWKGGTIRIIGTFGTSDDTSEPDDTAYSFVYWETAGYDLTLDFTECSLIQAKACQFGHFRNCKVKGLHINYAGLEFLPETAQLHSLVYGENATFENCRIYGSMSGSVPVTCWNLLNSRLQGCRTDFSYDEMLYGIMAEYGSYISGCEIHVSGTAEETAAGISALNSHVSGSRFTAEGKTAYGGLAGGNYTECTFSGLGELNGYGFSVSGTLNAGNCIFTGYTKDTETGEGIGISAGSRAKILLHGMTCPENVVHGYSQTGSLVVADGGQGYYDGRLYTDPVLPETDTVVTYTDFMPFSVMTQASYDEITPHPNRAYILEES